MIGTVIITVGTGLCMWALMGLNNPKRAKLQEKIALTGLGLIGIGFMAMAIADSASKGLWT